MGLREFTVLPNERGMLLFLTRNARWLSGGLLLTLFSSFGQTFFIGLSGRYILEEFALTDGEFGLIYMVCTLASAATLPWLGQMVDRLNGARMVLVVMPALAFACILMAISPIVPVLALAIYLLRLMGQGMMTHIALTEVSRWFDANRGRAISLIVPGHQLGEAVLPILFALVVLASGWRSAWFVSAALILFAALPAIYLLIRVDRVPADHDPVDYKPKAMRQWSRFEVLRDPFFYIIIIGVLAPAFIGTTVFFHQAHLIELRDYPPLAFASAFPMMAATTVICGFAAGQLIDRLGAIRLLPFFLVPLALATLISASIEASWGIYVFMVMFGVSYGLTSPMLGALWPEIYGTRHLGAIRAVVVAALVFATAMGPGLTGAFIDQGVDLPTQLYWMAGWTLAASYGLFLASRAVAGRQEPA